MAARLCLNIYKTGDYLMKTFCFTVDDNIRFFKEINEQRPKSIFEHPYLNMYLRLHKKFKLKVQLNLFFETDDFNLCDMTDAYLDEFKYNSNWLKLSFHSKLENVNPYKSSSFDEMFCDCQRVNEQIVRFASRDALAETTTIHYCLATNDCLKAIKDCGIKGLLGLYGSKENPRTSYQIDTLDAEKIRNGNIVKNGNIFYAPIDIVLNDTPPERIKSMLDNMKTRKHIWVMIHEQYFYPDYHRYIESYEELLENTFTHLTENGFTSCFYEELL